MKFVLLSIAALALAACAAIPEPEPICTVQPAGSTVWYPCGSDAAKAANCLPLMETAMKAVDPYLDNMSLPDDKRDRVLKVWERAKQACWAELKNSQPQHYH